ncbi:hypothetical protein [Lewinella sp. IMCC34183]|uniref:hypothetical protein n=1 Tax=Lewinella sp. IMCC34183 TaxID=2248762 RepID=UPI0018E5063A|nr:hypothetical protein [Lewinella sp. IMCC34183]
MRVLRNPFWWIAVVAFVLHQVAQLGFGLRSGLLDGYLDPFLCPPVLLGLWLLERRVIFRVPRLTALETAVATLLLAVLFEEVFPRYEEGFSRDVIDYLFYGLGGVYFYFLVNRHPKKA